MHVYRVGRQKFVMPDFKVEESVWSIKVLERVRKIGSFILSMLGTPSLFWAVCDNIEDARLLGIRDG